MTATPTFSREFEPDKNYNASLTYMKGENQVAHWSADEGLVSMTAQAMHQMMQQLGYKLVKEERHNG